MTNIFTTVIGTLESASTNGATIIVNIIPIIMSVISLLVSLVVAYLVYLKPAKPRMLINKRMGFYPIPWSNLPGQAGVGFYLPITFYNWSPTGGSILEVRIIINHQDTPTQNFDITWADFHKTIELSNGIPKWELEGMAQPIAIPGRSSISKSIRFIWYFDEGGDMLIRTGRYKITILAWTCSRIKPDLEDSFFFTLTDDHVTLYKANANDRKPLTIEVFLGESSRLNNILTTDQIKKLYS